MENRISVLPDINMEVGGGNLGSWWRFWEATSKGQNAKLVTMAQEAPHEGLSIRWGTFSPRELARFRKLLEKLVRLKPASFSTIASAIQIGALEEFLKESSLLGVKADLGEFGTNESPKAARIARRQV
ncbi:hypothetical protein Goshw_023142 [Gossypium schwendimanii]|uniref:Uncharacterized protein n=1 Tax=Gossypium schwendimanii TaxID=34291 RepID=A0A7J9MDQ9_GOSSC|nr:hypothetical protein [Gossypium schwendimanii]